MPRPSNKPKLFSCPICKKRFVTKYARDIHVTVIHKNAGRFKCKRCGKASHSKSSLIVHQRNHTGEKPFGCKICKKRFCSQSGLTSHHLANHSKKKFKCGQCDKEFGRKPNLKTHLSVHSNERPFACTVKHCSKAYKDKTNLKLHLANQHSIDLPKAARRWVSAPKLNRIVQVEAWSDEDQVLNGRQQYSLRARHQRPNYRDDQYDYEESDENGESRSAENDDTIASVRNFDEDESEYEQLEEGESEDEQLEEGESEYEQSDESEEENEQPASCTVNSSHLKFVFDVEYKAPE